MGAVWLSPWRGGAAFPPYDLQDIYAILLFGGLPALTFALVAVGYGSGRYLLATGGAHLVIYFGTHAWPHGSRYPVAGLLGSQPQILAGIIVVYGLGLGLAVLRQRLSGFSRPGPWLAGLLTTLMGAIFLYQLLSALPGNGAYLGYEQTGLYVPANAWDVSRPAAEFLALLALFAAVTTGMLPIAARLGKGRDRAAKAAP